jgi:hypothetical protein
MATNHPVNYVTQGERGIRAAWRYTRTWVRATESGHAVLLNSNTSIPPHSNLNDGVNTEYKY